jgi:hypothetical protein
MEGVKEENTMLPVFNLKFEIYNLQCI